MAFRYDGRVQTVVGVALQGASIAVLTQPANTSTQPGTPRATLFAAANSNAATITGAVWSAGLITFTFSAPPPVDVVAGSFIGVTGINPAGYNNVWQVTTVVGNLVTVTTPYTLAPITNPGSYVSGGTVATSSLPNPFLSDALGNFFFYAASGIYTVQIYDTLGRIPTQLVLADQNVVAGGGAGSVTSVALALPAEFTVTGSPVTTSGTLTGTKATQTQKTFWGGPTSGAPAAPTFRTLLATDLPAGTGTVTSVALTIAVPGFLTQLVTGSPVTTSGTLAITLALANQTANQFLAGPTSGAAAPPTFRVLVPADVAGAAPGLLATVDLTAQTAPVAATTLFTPIVTGLYTVKAYLKITTVGTSPVIGPVTITYTDGTDSVAQSVVMAQQLQTGAMSNTGNNGNTTTSVLTGSLDIWAKSGVAIQYAIALTGTVGAAQYEAHLKLLGNL